MNNTDPDKPSTWSKNRGLIDGLIDTMGDEVAYSHTGAWLVRKRTHDGAYIVYEAKEVRYD